MRTRSLVTIKTHIHKHTHNRINDSATGYFSVNNKLKFQKNFENK